MALSVGTARSALVTQSARQESLLSSPEPDQLVVAKRVSPPSRRKPQAPKDSKIYKAVLAFKALKAQGYSTKDIAEHIGLAPNTIKQYVCYANKRGWLKFDDLSQPEDQLELVLAGKAVRNLNQLLDNKDGCLGDKDITLEVAKGLGLLKQHQVVKQDGGASVGVALSVHFEMPAGLATTVRTGSCGGAPAFEGEVVPDAE
jgi:hypothetical protein